MSEPDDRAATLRALHRDERARRWLGVAAGLGLLVLAVWLWRPAGLWGGDSLRSAHCAAQYSAARTAADSDAVDHQRPMLHDADAPRESCGELRRAGRIRR